MPRAPRLAPLAAATLVVAVLAAALRLRPAGDARKQPAGAGGDLTPGSRHNGRANP